MKPFITLLLVFFVSSLGLQAQDSKKAVIPDEEEVTPTEEKVIPTEESAPPFEVGQLANVAGYYIDLEEGMRINFRMVATKMRVYWLDADGLIVEPLSKEGNVRFRKTVNGKKLFQLASVSGDVALGHPEFIPYPHTFNLVLNLKSADSGELDTYPLRYVQPMSTVKTRDQ